MRSRTITLGAGFLALPALIALSACDSVESSDMPKAPDTRGEMYCGTYEGIVRPAEYCDGDGDEDGSSFIFLYPSALGQRYHTGQKLPASGFVAVGATDQAARQKMGIPARGGFGGNGTKYGTVAS